MRVMTRFLHWRKMTWSILVRSGAMTAWAVATVFTAPDVAADCATDSQGLATSVITRQECISAAGGTNVALLLIVLVWVLGLISLSVTWFLTRPLWCQGYGARLRRLRSAEMWPGPAGEHRRR
jgi:hypothetical protein